MIRCDFFNPPGWDVEVKMDLENYFVEVLDTSYRVKRISFSALNCSLDTCYLSIDYQQSEHKTTLTKSQINTVSSFIKEHKFELEIDANKKIDPTYVPLQYYYTSTKKEKIIILKPMFK